MKRDDFIAASISTRIYEDDLISKRDLERLNDYESLKEVLDALSDTSYQGFIQELDRPEDYEYILTAELKRAYEKISDISPDKNLSQYLIEKYNFHNLKVAVKEIIQDADYRDIYSPMANVDIDYVKREILKTTDDGLIFTPDESLNEDPRDIYVDFAKKAIKAYEDYKDPAMIDISLDKSYYERVLKIGKETGLDSLVDYTRQSIDLINLKTLLRLKSQEESLDRLRDSLIEGGFIDKDRFIGAFSLSLGEILESLVNDSIYPYVNRALSADKSEKENLLDLEKSIDDHFLDYAKKAKSMTYGPEVLLAYIIGKEQEIKNLRIIFISKLNSLPKDFTTERLRESYV